VVKKGVYANRKVARELVDFEVKFTSSKSKTMENMLEELDIKEGFCNFMGIEISKWKYTQILDYILAPFCCVRFSLEKL